MGQWGVAVRDYSRIHGFTLIELMVSVAIVILFAALALPSFEGVRQRAATRAAAEQILSFWNNARMEAAKRNQMIKVGIVQSSSGAVFCLGAATTASGTDTTPCLCTAALDPTNTNNVNADDKCDVAVFPGANTEWRGSTLSGVTLGDSDWPTVNAIKPAVIESKRTALTVAASDGTITINGPSGFRNYMLRLSVDQFGRAVLCEPTSATAKLSDFGGRRCSP